MKILKMKNESMKEAIKSDREKNELLDVWFVALRLINRACWVIKSIAESLSRRVWILFLEKLLNWIRNFIPFCMSFLLLFDEYRHKNEVDYKHELKKYLTLHPYVVYFLYACAFGIGCCFSSKINSLLDYYGMKE